MLKYNLIIALLLCTSLASAQWGNKKIKGNGNITTETRQTSDYDNIKCAGSFNYILVRGNEGKITLEGEENLLKYIIVEVKGDALVVKTEKNYNLKSSQGKQIKITIPFEEVSGVALAGSGDLRNDDVITADDLKVALAGSGDMNLKVKSNFLKGSLAGSGDLSLMGETDELKAEVAGSGNFHGFNLNANNTEVSIAGSGDAEVSCNGELKARVAGSGDIEYKGNPTNTDTKVAGSGRIVKN